MNLQLHHSQKYANVGPRFVAGMIDSLLVNLPMMAGWYWLLSQQSLTSVVTTFFSFLAYVFFPVLFFQFGYYFISLARWGKTIGKAVVGLEVLDSKEEKLSYTRAFMRENVSKGISGAMLGLGFWAVAFNPHHQAWHDELAGSFVYRREERILLGLVALFSLIALYAMIGFNLFQVVSRSPILQEMYSLLPQNLTP